MPIRPGTVVLKRHFASSVLHPHFTRTSGMATVSQASIVNGQSLSHEERTSGDSRQDKLHLVTLTRIDELNDNLRLLNLSIHDVRNGVKFLPGQWLDVHIPGLRQAGGFTITSVPREAQLHSVKHPSLHLVVQRSRNAAAGWLWQAKDEVIDTILKVRVGGSFHWPPLGIEVNSIRRLVLIAGGVGINPLISILDHVVQSILDGKPAEEHIREIVFLYSAKSVVLPKDRRCTSQEKILFLSRVERIMHDVKKLNGDRPRLILNVRLFMTSDVHAPDSKDSIVSGRISSEDLARAMGASKEEKQSTVVYVCGPQKMTDDFVDFLQGIEDVDPKRVLCEKWW